MYKFKRNIYVGEEVFEMWFGLTSKSQDRHTNFTLFLLTEGPDHQFSYAEKIKGGFHAKADATRYAVQYAKELIRQKMAQEKASKQDYPETDDESIFDEQD